MHGLSIGDFDDVDNKLLILDCINDAIMSLPYSIAFRSG